MDRVGGNSTLTAVGFKALFVALCCFLLLSPAARAEEDELRSLELYNGSEVETVSVGRSPRPASQTAENITVVTARDIEALNAHNLVDVLYTVTGVQLEEIRTPGSISLLKVQGSKYNHVLVLIDNVPINNLADNAPDIGSVPVQMIERIEVVKGAASSSWGNALGGVINIITKAPQAERPYGGLISASAGKASTIDGRAEISGTAKRFGYYLTGGKLRSDGLLPNNWTDLNHFYGKLHYELPSSGSFSVTTLVTGNAFGMLYYPAGVTPTGRPIPESNADMGINQLLGTASFYAPLSDRFSIEGMYRTRRMESDVTQHIFPGDILMADQKNKEQSDGGVFKFSYLDELQRVVAGVDYDHLHDDFTLRVGQGQTLVASDNRKDNRVGVYLNDTFTLGKFAVTPSARFDHTEINGSLFSPSFGVTYALTDNSVLRGYTAKGYSLITVLDKSAPEQVWTSQVGFETADIPYLWLKGTLFRNDTWDIRVDHPDGTITHVGQLKQGYEVEARTVPFLSTSFSVGYTFIDARRVADLIVPKHTLNLGVKYEDNRQLRVLLTGHYIDWNDPTSDGQYHDIIWDLYLAKRINYSDTVYVEFFGSLRNVFNGEQFISSYYKNPGRWGEVGIRCGF